MRKDSRIRSIPSIPTLALVAFAHCASAWCGGTRVATYGPGPDPVFANLPCDGPACSPDGRFVIFDTRASNLAAPTSDLLQVMIRDLATGKLELISMTGGIPGSSHSQGGSMSADSRFVAFASSAENLVGGGNPGEYDIVVHDRLTRINQLISVGVGGVPANGKSLGAAISGDGRYVVFVSTASNLVPNDNNDTEDVFRFDRVTRTTMRVNLTADGQEPVAPSFWYPIYLPTISADGRYVAFSSRQLLAPVKTSTDSNDVFVKDMVTGAVVCASMAAGGLTTSNGESLAQDLTPDGRFVVFDSTATNLHPTDHNNYYDVYVRDLLLGTTDLASVRSDGSLGSQNCEHARISADARFVVFSSGTPDLAPPFESELDYDIFVRDRVQGTTERVALNEGGNLPNAPSNFGDIADDGMNVTFASAATNLDASVDPGVDPQQQTLVRYRTGFRSLFGGKPGSVGIAKLSGNGSLEPATLASIVLDHALPNQPVLIAVALEVGKPGPLVFSGGELLANPPVVLLPLVTDPAGKVVLEFRVRPIPAAIELLAMQAVITDPGASHGISLSNLLVAALP